MVDRLGRSPGGGHGNPPQHSCLENPMDRGAWWTTVHGVTKNQTLMKQLSMNTCHLYRVEEILLRALCPAKGIPEFRVFQSVQSLSCVLLSATPWTAAGQVSLFHHQLLELAQTRVHRVGDAIQPSHLLLSPSPPAFNLSQHQVFSNESVLCIRWSKYWSFSFSISPSNEYSGLISFRMDWFDAQSF